MTQLRDGLARKDLNKTQKYLLIVGQHDGPIASKDIKAIAKENGWRDGAESRPEAFLGKSDCAILLPAGWTLSGPGRAKLEKNGVILPIGVLTPVTAALETYLLKVHDARKRNFVEEAVSCAKNKCFRAAIVLSWVGAVYLLYHRVLSHELSAFNAEVSRRWPKVKPAVNVDDLAIMKESDFLSVIEHIGLITKAELKELSSCLDRRNTAGHPNSHAFVEVNVGSHIQTLTSVVFARV